jgi:hypothetical protein
MPDGAALSVLRDPRVIVSLRRAQKAALQCEAQLIPVSLSESRSCASRVMAILGEIALMGSSEAHLATFVLAFALRCLNFVRNAGLARPEGRIPTRLYRKTVQSDVIGISLSQSPVDDSRDTN